MSGLIPNLFQAKTRIKLNFLDRIAKFWELQGTALKIPLIDKKPLDLYNLQQAVRKDGTWTLNSDHSAPNLMFNILNYRWTRQDKHRKEMECHRPSDGI